MQPISPHMITTAFTLDGYKITRNLGLVRGITVRSRSIVGSFFASVQTIFGGNISIVADGRQCHHRRTIRRQRRDAGRRRSSLLRNSGNCGDGEERRESDMRRIVMVLILVLACTGSLASTNEPPELTSARQRYERAVNIATEQYQVELQSLQRSVTQRGDLNGALLVKKELERIQTDAPPSPKQEPIRGAQSGGSVVEFKGHRYQVYADRVTRKKAEHICQQLGGHLASIDSEDELVFIQNYLKSQEQFDHWISATIRDRDTMWIGTKGILRREPREDAEQPYICEWDK
jgi:hypothetical protein